MRSLLLLITLALIIISCSKDNDAGSLRETGNKWIEKTQRLDTIDFDPPYPGTVDGNKVFYLRSAMETMPGATQLMFSSIYAYSFEGAYINLRGMHSSSLSYNKYEFKWTAGHRSFIVNNFYNRQSLPAKLEFIPLK
ncbi:MAG: hypothetical protein J7621_01080 [Niastella sp.]|nr:hypothetical protein [Niastella sp.]